ncbi:MAG: S8 family serine peptidase [Bacteroidota bacterium]
MRNVLLLSIFSFLFFVSCQKETFDEKNSAEEQMEMSKKSAFNGSYMVISKSETLTSKLEASIKKHGKITNTIPEIGVAVVKTSDPNFEKKMMKLPEVRSVVPDLNINWIAPIDVKPLENPPSIGDGEYFYDIGYLWSLDTLDAPEAWNTDATGDGVRIAIIDTGIDADHPDLAPNINTELSKSFVKDEDLAIDEDWNVRDGEFFNHGSHVAGIAAGADSDYGIIGVAPNAEIVAIKVISEYDDGPGYLSWLIQGITYAGEIKADVINMSVGASFNKNGNIYGDDGNLIGRYHPASIQELLHLMQKAIDFAHRNGSTIITSAGNSAINGDGNNSQVFIPADLNHVISVSATGKEDIPAYYTNFGRSLIDISAPGGDVYYSYSWYDAILSAGSESFWWAQGTSMSAPHVAGVAALIIGENGGDMSPIEVEKQLYKTADNIDANGQSLYYGKGRVNAYRAVTE